MTGNLLVRIDFVTFMVHLVKKLHNYLF